MHEMREKIKGIFIDWFLFLFNRGGGGGSGRVYPRCICSVDDSWFRVAIELSASGTLPQRWLGWCVVQQSSLCCVIGSVWCHAGKHSDRPSDAVHFPSSVPSARICRGLVHGISAKETGREDEPIFQLYERHWAVKGVCLLSANRPEPLRSHRCCRRCLGTCSLGWAWTRRRRSQRHREDHRHREDQQGVWRRGPQSRLCGGRPGQGRERVKVVEKNF